MTKRANGWRLAGLLVMTLAIAHCGDGGSDNGHDEFSSPGTFIGSTSAGGAFRLEAGSIDAVAFDCDGTDIQERFSPPSPVDADGNFDVRFSDAGRDFRVRGRFSGDAVGGTIEDEQDDCDVAFEATRGDRTATPTPLGTFGPTNLTATRTPAPTVPTPTGSTPTGSTPTPTVTTTPTAATETPTPTPTATNGHGNCPIAVEVLGAAGNDKVLDSGWTGLAHNATVISDGKLTFSVSGCANPVRPCGVCNVGGPIQNVNADKGDINAHRCNNDTSIKCSSDTECGGANKCAFYFGAPLPLTAGGIGSCVVNELNGAISGTANVESGAFKSTINLTSRVALGPDFSAPCPKCEGDTTKNDGKKDGHCNGGKSNGQPCDGNGTAAIASFGTTSLDCPPTSFASALTIALEGSSGTETRTLGASSPNCAAFGFQSKKCFCSAGGPGAASTTPNACTGDNTTTPEVDESVCAQVSPNEGECPGEPVDLYCSPTETFRSCGSNADCSAQGDTCKVVPRPCYLDNGAIGGSVSAVGMADPPVNGTAHPVLASLFCIPSVKEPSISTAGGLPGLGRLQLPLVTKEILSQ